MFYNFSSVEYLLMNVSCYLIVQLLYDFIGLLYIKGSCFLVIVYRILHKENSHNVLFDIFYIRLSLGNLFFHYVLLEWTLKSILKMVDAYKSLTNN